MNLIFWKTNLEVIALYFKVKRLFNCKTVLNQIEHLWNWLILNFRKHHHHQPDRNVNTETTDGHLNQIKESTKNANDVIQNPMYGQDSTSGKDEEYHSYTEIDAKVPTKSEMIYNSAYESQPPNSGMIYNSAYESSTSNWTTVIIKTLVWNWTMCSVVMLFESKLSFVK